MLVSGLHRYAGVWPGRIDRTGIVSPKELALVSPGDHQALAVLLQFGHESFVGHFPCAFADVSGGKLWFAENVEIVDFDQEVAFAACSALVASGIPGVFNNVLKGR